VDDVRARVRQAHRVLIEDGNFTLGGVGQVREHPTMNIERERTAMLLRLAEHFACLRHWALGSDSPSFTPAATRRSGPSGGRRPTEDVMPPSTLTRRWFWAKAQRAGIPTQTAGGRPG
jgi:hypothetical protein